VQGNTLAVLHTCCVNALSACWQNMTCSAGKCGFKSHPALCVSMSMSCPFHARCMPAHAINVGSNAQVLLLLLSAVHDQRMHGLNYTCFCLSSPMFNIGACSAALAQSWQHGCLQVSVPQVSVPQVSVPQVNVPQVSVPQVSVNPRLSLTVS
jgi:hypothetical protein